MPIFDTPKIKDHKELYIFLRRTAANPYKISMIQALGSAKRNCDKTWVRDDAALNSNLIAGLDRAREKGMDYRETIPVTKRHWGLMSHEVV